MSGRFKDDAKDSSAKILTCTIPIILRKILTAIGNTISFAPLPNLIT
jgi:hypothetical protein